MDTMFTGSFSALASTSSAQREVAEPKYRRAWQPSGAWLSKIYNRQASAPALPGVY
jgi:hypothetical protein